MKKIVAAEEALQKLREPGRLAWLKRHRKEIKKQAEKQRLHQERRIGARIIRKK